MSDSVNHPSHYESVVKGVECIDVTEQFNSTEEMQLNTSGVLVIKTNQKRLRIYARPLGISTEK